MIKEIYICNREIAERVLAIQLQAYKVEAELIGVDDIPPLKDTVDTLQQCGEIFFGYYLAGELCGFISFKTDEDELDIHRLVVHPDYFRKGIARELLNFVEDYVQPRLVKVATASTNWPAVELYQKKGFEKVKDVVINELLSLTFFEKRR